MAYSKALNEATKRWVKANREKITFTTEKGFNNRLKECAEKMGMSKQEFIIETLKREMGKSKMKLYWANFIVGGERPYLISHSNPYPTLEKANDSVKNTLESLNVILSYIQEQDTETGKMTPVIVTPYVNSMGTKI